MVAEAAFERLGSLVALLTTTEQPLTLEEIARRVGGYPDGKDARRKQFQRDRSVLAAEGIVVTEAEDRYRIRPEDYELPALDLTDDEVAALGVAMAAVPVVAAEAPFALAALGALTERGSAGDAPMWLRAQLAELPVVPRVHAALRERATLGFAYDGVDREVEPIGLLFREGWWYLRGHDRTRGARRWYRLDRIEGDVALGAPGSAGPRPDVDVATELATGPWAIGAGSPVEAEVEVDEVLAAKVAWEVRDLATVEDRPGGAIVVRLPVTHPAGFRSWVLGMLDHAEVLGPPELRADVVAWLERAAQ